MTAELDEEPTGPVNPLRDPQDRRLPRIAGPCSLVIFGVTGDLARKKLMPAVYDLANRGLLPPGFALVGFARRDYTNQDFAQIVHDSVKEHARTPFREEVWQQLAEGFRFVPGDLTDDEAFKRLRETVDELDVTRGTGGNHAFYLSIPPGLFPEVVRQLSEHGLTDEVPGSWRRVVIEKPFGHDLKSARELNRVVESVFPPEAVFRIDHYLGKETVQNMLALRFANAMFEPVWNSHYVDHVQITMAEDIGIGGRAGYYDGIGAARDVIQNHLLQLLALVAMEEPVSFDAWSLRQEKKKVLAAVQLPERLDLHTARGQYAAGWAGGVKVKGYLQEDGIPRDLRDRDVRGAAGRRRHPPLGRRPVLPAHRQAARPPGHRGRGDVQARTAPAVQQDRDRRARPERPGPADPAGRGHHHALRRQGARDGDGDPRREHGLRVRRFVHRVLPRGVRAADPRRTARRPAAVPAAHRGRAGLEDPRPGDQLLGQARQAGAVRVRRLGPGLGARDARPRRTRLEAAMIIDLTDTTSSEIASALLKARRNAGSPAMGMVGTIVVVVDEASHHDAMKAANEAGREHPSRVLVAILRPGRGASGLDAEVRVGEGIPGEAVLLRLHGELAKVPESVVTPLLLPDSPVIVWWPGGGPKVPADDPLGRLGRRRVTDAAATRRASVDFTARAEGYAARRHGLRVDPADAVAGADGGCPGSVPDQGDRRRGGVGQGQPECGPDGRVAAVRGSASRSSSGTRAARV